MKYRALNILKDECKLALILLNQPLRRDLLDLLWQKSSFVVCVDGAIMQLYNMLPNTERDAYIPNYITGDFDTSTEAVREFYRNKGTTVIETPDQDATDFTKSLKTIASRVNSSKECDYVAVMGATGGRLDLTFANLNTLYEGNSILPNITIYLFSDESFTFLLSEGNNDIYVDSGFEHEWCGFIPLGERCGCVTTSGLKYNVDGEAMEIGGLISACNTYTGSPQVTITSDKPLLWTMGYQI